MIYWTDCAVVIAAADIAVAEFGATAFVAFETRRSSCQFGMYRSNRTRCYFLNCDFDHIYRYD